MVAQCQGPLDCSALLLSSHHRPAKLLQTVREAVVRIKARSLLGSHWVPSTLIVCRQSDHPGLFQPFSELCAFVFQPFHLWLPAPLCGPCSPQPLGLSPSPETPFSDVHQKCIRSRCFLLCGPMAFTLNSALGRYVSSTRL